jgi:hypothetical protein
VHGEKVGGEEKDAPERVNVGSSGRWTTRACGAEDATGRAGATHTSRWPDRAGVPAPTGDRAGQEGKNPDGRPGSSMTQPAAERARGQPQKDATVARPGSREVTRCTERVLAR